MKKLLYIAFNNSENQLFGVRAKILSQCRALGEYGYDVELVQRKNAETVIFKDGEEKLTVKKRKQLIDNLYVRSVLDKQNQIKDVKKYVDGKKYNACYIRYDFSDHGFISLLKKLHKVCDKIVIELPTYPYDDENKAKLLSKIKLSVDKIFRKKLSKYVDFIVTFYGGYDRIFDIPVVVIPNGFDFSTMSLVKNELEDDVLHIIAVSSMREWHGYERFIEGMKNYYKESETPKRELILHLVGNGREYGKYKSLSEEYGLQDRIIMEGAMHGEMLDSLYEKCALGIDSLARHRSGIDVLSSLKSREYGAKGVPMINSCMIDIFPDDYPYMLKVPADESPVDINEVFEFYDNCYKDKRRIDVGRQMRKYVEEKSGMKQTFTAVVKELEK